MIKPLLGASALVIALACQPSFAQRSAPTAVPVVRSVPDAVDTPWPGGPITLAVDASDTTHAAWRVTETIPLAPGTTSLALQLPQWIPGDHAANGTIEQIVGIRFYADGQEITWHRDPVEVFAFHLDLPAGTREVTARFIDSSPLQGDQGRVTMTGDILNLQWAAMSLYPAGHYVRQIRVRPEVTLPDGWEVASALDGRQQAGNHVRFAETDYETLVDSPIFAGANFKRFDLGHNVALDVVADRAGDLAVKPENLAHYRALVDEALLAYGSHHFDHYDILLGLTDRLGGIGLEHHRSSENTMDPKALVEWDDFDWGRNVIPHEISHSWDGKFRRPARLWTPDYRQPMQDNLLWVYEGQNQFWGLVLAARSGVQSKRMVLAELANYAGMFSQWSGRDWRSVEDTTFDEIMAHRRPKAFADMTRNEDYYTEGALVWLEADQIIRQGTQGRRGLDDFAKAFFGIRDGDWGEVPYEFGDVVAALNSVYPYDWAGFLDRRINHPGQPDPVGGIELGGYRLVWKEVPNEFDRARMSDGKYLSLFHSLGIVIDKDNRVSGSRWDSAGFNAGLVPGTRLLAVGGHAYDPDLLKDAITAAKGTDKPIDLVVQRGDRVWNVSISYHDGLRWPWLDKAGDSRKPAGLDLLLAPRRAGAN